MASAIKATGFTVGWMAEEISFLSGFAEGRDAGIFPNVRSVSAESPQLDVVPMGGIAMFEDEYEFMPAPIE